jgi:alpha-N-acetylglucosaminidase
MIAASAFSARCHALWFLLLVAMTASILPRAAAGQQGPAVTAPQEEEQQPLHLAAEEVLARLVPHHSHRFRLQLQPASRFFDLPGGAPSSPELDSFARVNTPRDYFIVAALNGTVYVEGTSPVALTSGAYYYLKTVTKGQMTWGVNGTGDQLRLPDRLPDLCSLPLADLPPTDNPFSLRAALERCWVRRSSSVSFRYAWNMCTFSYSAAFWDELRWEREVDWMAMHGINFPLALTGQEYVWMELFRTEYNVSLEQLQPWFSGPAFLAWQRAGNIRGFAGPLSLHWITGQMELQKKILKQMRSLGMTPILPCFAGHVPAVAREIWPNAKFTQSDAWNHFAPNETDVWYLDPTDPVFIEIGTKFTEKLVEVFGTDHFYSCDTFNEVDPSQADEAYLKASSAAVHRSIAAVDPNGVWVLQAWLFHFQFWTIDRRRVKWYLSGVANDAMIILDLNSEEGALAAQFSNYHGKPWVWNLLHNYGGVRGMYGKLDVVAKQPFDWIKTSAATRNRTKQIGMVGIGFTPEAIEQNPIMYELLTETLFYSYFNSSQTLPAVIDTQMWLEQYVTQRYGLDAIAEAEGPTSSLPSSSSSSSASSVAEGQNGQGEEEVVSQLAHSPSPSVRSFWSAWQHLFQAVYDQPGHPRSEIEFAPEWRQASFGWANGDATHMSEAVEPFLSALSALPDKEELVTGGMMYDLVDIVRQASTMFFSDMHRMYAGQGWRALQASYGGFGGESSFARIILPASGLTGQPDRSLRRLGAHMLSLIRELDALFATNPNYLLGTWLESAVRWADPSPSAHERSVRNMLYNAKNQLTLWGPEAQINDYAAKAWSGLYKDYYAVRWALMINSMVSTAEGTTEDRWSGTAYESELLAFEESWVARATRYPSQPTTAFVRGSREAALDDALARARRLVSLINPCGTSPVRIVPRTDLYGKPVGRTRIACNFTDFSDSSVLPRPPENASFSSFVTSLMRVEFDVYEDKTLESDSYMYGEELRTRNLGQLMLLCALQDDCLGFVSDGGLRRCADNIKEKCPSSSSVKKALVSQDGSQAFVKVSLRVLSVSSESDNNKKKKLDATETRHEGSTTASGTQQLDEEPTSTNSSYDVKDDATTTPSSFDNDTTATPSLADADSTLTGSPEEAPGEYSITVTPISPEGRSSAVGLPPSGNNNNNRMEELLFLALVLIAVSALVAIVYAFVKVKLRQRPAPGAMYQRTSQREGDAAETDTLADASADEEDDDDGALDILPQPNSTKPPVSFSIAARKAQSYVEARPPRAALLAQTGAGADDRSGSALPPAAAVGPSLDSVEMTDWQSSPPPPASSGDHAV